MHMTKSPGLLYFTLNFELCCWALLMLSIQHHVISNSQKTKDHPTSDISDKSTDVSSLKQSESEAPPQCHSTGYRCIRSCQGLPDGDYQSCHSCHVYASCTNGSMIDDGQCAPAQPPLNWDDRAKRCLHKSLTCRCYNGEDTKVWSLIIRVVLTL